jgi:phenylacetic acid degradation operon negative regulatory protein
VLTTFRCEPAGDPAALVARLWDLPGWADAGRQHLARLAGEHDPARRLAAAALLVRHLASDPLLPPELLPPDWPGSDLRAVYAAYQEELRALTLTAPEPSSVSGS